MAQENKTEKATEHRKQKAREEGQVARSRELSSQAALLSGLLVVVWRGPENLLQWRRYYFAVLEQGVRTELSIASPILKWTAQLIFDWSAMPLAAACGVAILVSVAQGGMVISAKPLTPDIAKLSPAKKIGQMFGITTLIQLLKAIVPTAAILYIATGILRREWPGLSNAVWASPRQIASHLFSVLFEVFWKSGLILLVWAVVDYIAMRQKFEGDLRMSKQEVREELKQTDGNPATKGRIRRLQRQVRRTRMVQATKRATVVVTNPTHYAVALEYRDEMPAPMVVAKGQNLLAQQIKEIARWEGVPVIENPPLAQSLYRTVEVGQRIPEKLYAAVAEILAYIFRMNAEVAARRHS